MKTPFKKRSLIPFVFLGVLAALAVLHTGCAAQKGVSGPDYSETLARWTRVEQVYEGLEPRLIIKATYKNRPFRDAYIERYVDDYRLSSRYKEDMREKALELSELYNEFLMAAHTSVNRWNDFDRTDSIWKLYLEDNLGNRLTPVSIEKLDAGDPLIREFFPYVGLWSSIYVVRFPKYSEAGTEPIPGAGTDYLRLTIAGALGSGELEWRLKEE